MSLTFLADLAKRRSIYKLGKGKFYGQSDIQLAIRDAMKFTPAAFDMPTTNVITAFGAKHEELWAAVREVFAKKLAKKQDALDALNKKIDGFVGGEGTILFYEDQSMVEELKQTYAMYADNFASWSLQGCGMVQLNIWSALANINLGANLQHYNPDIDAAMKEMFSVPDGWKLISQMPFGSILEYPRPKDYDEPLGEDRLKVFK